MTGKLLAGLAVCVVGLLVDLYCYDEPLSAESEASLARAVNRPAVDVSPDTWDILEAWNQKVELPAMGCSQLRYGAECIPLIPTLKVNMSPEHRAAFHDLFSGSKQFAAATRQNGLHIRL